MESHAVRGTDVASEQVEVLAATRDRTLALIAGLDDVALSRVVDPLLSPLLWDLGHIANFEQRWLLGSDDSALDGVYNPFEHPRAERGELEVLSSDECFTYMGAVREQVFQRAKSLDPFLLELVIQHEQQHNETMLQLLRQMEGYAPPQALADEYLAPPAGEQHIRLREAASRAYRPMSRSSDMIAFPAGNYLIGTEPEARTLIYDNELNAHKRDVDAFEIATRPVTNGDYAEWIEFGGYKKPEWWTPEGWEWLAEQGDDFDAAPLGWHRSSGGWVTTDFGADEPIDLSAPVCHVNWHEASAYARAHGARLPTELEWEVAASYDPRIGASGERRTYAWGDNAWVPGAANLDQLAFGAHPVGSADHGFAPIDMLGQVWEWTNSEFSAYPGFSPFAYEQYSEPFFDGGYRVLRGGSWATRARTVTNTFRNWDLPSRRQIFSGFRLARSAT